MLRIVTCFCIALAALCVSNLALAENDFSRPGCYLGLGAAGALSLSAEDVLDDEAERIFGAGSSADVDESLGLHARVGCRGTWGGGELHYEWIEGFDIDVADRSFKVDGWAVSLDGKLYLIELVHEILNYYEDDAEQPQMRFQPFAIGGFGYLDFDLEKLRQDLSDAARTVPVFPPDGFEDWDFALRLGGGMDVYLTRNIAISLDTTWVYPLSDDLRDMDYLSFGLGFLYRF